MNNKQITGKLASEYCKKFQTATTQGVARALYNDNPEVFKSMEHARSVVRYYRGKSGKQHRNDAAQIIPRVIIPKADKPIDWTPFVIDTSPACFIGDIHLPYHDERVLDLFFNNCAKIGDRKAHV